MGLVREKTTFVTSDDKEHENLQAANRHQSMLNLKDAFRKYQDGRPGGMSITGFFDFLVAQRSLVLDYLDE